VLFAAVVDVVVGAIGDFYAMGGNGLICSWRLLALMADDISGVTAPK
jgi:hypothetical protein